MLRSLEIKNFQSHSNSRLDFHPGVNAIVGVSDSGKSAVLRALHWCRENRPTGEAHISRWIKNTKGEVSGECEVSVETAKGTVTRLRTPKFNGYYVNQLEFKAIRTDVPVEVASAFNFGRVNVHRQLDAPFLLAENGTEIARFFNKVVNLEDMGRIVGTAEKLRRSNEAEVKRIGKNIIVTQKDIEARSWVDLAGEKIQNAIETEVMLDHSKKSLNDLVSKMAVAYRAQNVIDRTASVPIITPIMERIKNRHDTLVLIGQRVQQLTTNVLQGRDLDLRLDGFVKWLPFAQVKLEGVRTTNVLLEKRIASHDTLQLSLFGARNWSKEIETSSYTVVVEPKLGAARESAQSLATLTSDHKSLGLNISRLRSTGDVLSKFDKIERISELLGEAKRMQEALAVSQLQELARKTSFAYAHTVTITNLGAEILELEKQLPEKCPACGQYVANSTHLHL